MAGEIHQHETELEVRDYECDLQGVVNNAVYLHYLEHARHRWLEAVGLDFAALHARGIDLVAVRIEIDYKHPLRSHDRFVVRSSLRREGRLRIVIDQAIDRLPDNRLVARAKVVVACLEQGRPSAPQEVFGVFDRLARAE